MIKDFRIAKILFQALAKKYNLKNMNDWLNFTQSKDFIEFKNTIPVRPDIYYSKQNVIKRLKKEIDDD